jgi:hypothetical protein
LPNTPKYGKVPKGDTLLAQFHAKRLGRYTFELYPELWTLPRIAEYYGGKAWTHTRFTDPPSVTLPATSGIYMFVVAPYVAKLQDHSYIFYVGQTDNLRRRYGEYLLEKEGKGTNPREEIVMFLHHLGDHVFFHYTEVPTTELDEAEDLLKDNLTPPANTRKTIIGRLKPT